MKVSYFETARYLAPRQLPAEWPVPPDAYDRDAGAQAYRGMIERLQFVEALGFDWVSVSEHHYSPQRLTPAPIVSAAHLAAYAQNIKIAVLGPIVSQSNPVQIAEDLAMLEGMELILKAWTEPQPFGWQGRHYQFRTVAVWPRPLQQPHPPTYALGSSRESCELAARHRLGLGLSYAPFEVVGKATRYYREQCEQYGWQPKPEQVIYRANILMAETDEEAGKLLEQQRGARRGFSPRGRVRDALLELDSRNIVGEARTPNVGGVLPTNFVGGPDTVVGQIRRCRDEVLAGIVDLMFQIPASGDLSFLLRSLEIFGKKVLPHIPDI